MPKAAKRLNHPKTLKISCKTGDKCFRILLLSSDHVLFMMEQILSTRADAPRVELCWLI